MFGTARSPRFVIRYILLALLFAVVVFIQIGSTRTILRQSPADFPMFTPGLASASLNYVDSKASAAGLHKGDILVAINGRPYTGRMIYLEETQNAVPGGTLVVTVRSPGANSRDRTVRLPVKASQSWLNEKMILISVTVLMPAFCIVLGFWVVLVRPGDLLAWLLLGLLLSFCELLSGDVGAEGWGPALIKLTTGYAGLLQLSWPMFMFLFGFYFPEPMPVFRRSGTWWKWLPWVVIVPYAIVVLVALVGTIGDLTSYSSVRWLSQILRPLVGVIRVYMFVLVSGFFFFIFSKSYRDIAPDSRRRQRLLSWGATVAFTPALLLALTAWLSGRSEFPDWLTSIVIVLFALFPLTLAYVIVVQRAMDIRVVLRQGLQYTLAKNGVRTLQVLALALVAATAVALIQQNRDRPQKMIVIALGSLAFFLHPPLDGKNWRVD